MKYTVTIITPKGSAGPSSNKIKLQMLPVARPKETIINDEEDLITLNFDTNPKKYSKVLLFFAGFNATMEKMWNSRPFQWKLKKASKEEIAQLRKSYFNAAKITVTEEPTTEELIASQESMWARIKNKVKKV